MKAKHTRKLNFSLLAVISALVTATTITSCSWTKSSDTKHAARLSDVDVQALVQKPNSTFTVIALTEVGKNAELAKLVKAHGGYIRVAHEKTGILIASLYGKDAQKLSEANAKLGGSAPALHLALDQQHEYLHDMSRVRLNPDTGKDNDPASVVIDRSPTNAQLPTHEMGVLTFEQEMKTRFGVDVNGETATIAVLDTGVDLAHSDVFQDRIAVSWDMTAEGRVTSTAATFVEDTKSVKVLVGTEERILKISDALTSPSNQYFLGMLREEHFAGKNNGDLDQNGSDKDSFDVLLTHTVSGWKVAIDTNHNMDFNDEAPTSDYEKTKESIVLDRSKAGLVRVNVNIPIDEDGDIVTNAEGRVDVNIAGYDAGQHGTHVAGIAAGRFDGPQFGGHFRGGAPRARILGIKVLGKNGGSDADILAGIVLAVEKGADIINMSLGGGRRPTDGLDTLSMGVTQVARRVDVLFMISAGNSGPGMNTIGSPSSSIRALSIGASITGATYRTAYNVPTAIDAHYLWWFSSRGPKDTGEVRPTLVAPGAAYSSIPLARKAGWNSGYDVFQGTSMAAPAATGAVASLLDAVRKLKGKLDLPSDPLTMKFALIDGAIDINALNQGIANAPLYTRVEQGAGVLNVPRTFAVLEQRLKERTPEYEITTDVLRDTYEKPGMGVYTTSRLPETISFTVRKLESEPVDVNEHNFDRQFVLTSDAQWVAPDSARIAINGLNASSVTLITDQNAIAALPSGVHTARITARNADNSQLEWTFDVTYVKARELSETFNRGEYLETGVKMRPAEVKRYFFYVSPDRTRLSASIRVPEFDQNGKPTDGRYRMTIHDPTGKQVGVTGYATGKDPEQAYITLNPVAGVWEIVMYRAFASSNDEVPMTFKFSTENFEVFPSAWTLPLPEFATELRQDFTVTSYGRSVSPVAQVKADRIGSNKTNVHLTNKQKTLINFKTPRSSAGLIIRTREVKGNANADIDLVLQTQDGKKIADSGGPTSEEIMGAVIPPETLVTLVIDAYDLAGQETGFVDVAFEFLMEKPLTGSTTFKGEPIVRGRPVTRTAVLGLTGLPRDMIDDVKQDLGSSRLLGEVSFFDLVINDKAKIGSVPIEITLP